MNISARKRSSASDNSAQPTNLHGLSLRRTLRKLLADPDVTISTPDTLGNQKVYRGPQEIGWVNVRNHRGWIEDKPAPVGAAPEIEEITITDDRPAVSAPLDEAVLAAEDTKALAGIETKSDLRSELRDVLDEDMCADIVNIAYSEDGEFQESVFDDSEVFFNDIIANEDPYEIARMFFYGEDLDSGGNANPTRDYFRFDGASNVESTDTPGTAYYKLLDDIVNYILDHLDYDNYPDEVQELVDEYNDVVGDNESEDEEDIDETDISEEEE